MADPLQITIHPANTMTPAPAGGNDAPDINPGQATPPPVGEGERRLNALRQGGFSNDQIGQYKQQVTDALQMGGFTPDQIEKHWGTPSLTSEALNDHIKRGFETVPEESHEKIAENPLDALAAGLQMSVAGLAVRGAKPDTTLGEQASIFQRIMYGAGQLAGDLPATVAGAFGGGGVAAGLTAETGPGAVIGGLVGAGAGAAMLPEAMRQTMLDIYKRGEAKTAGEILSMAGESVITTLKAGLLGGVAAPLGAAAGGVAGAVGGKVAKAGADIATQAGVFAGAGAAMEGHLPDAKDFISGAALAAAFHVGQSAVRAGKAKYNARGEIVPVESPKNTPEQAIRNQTEAVSHIQENFEQYWAKLGLTPWDVAEAAKHDTVIRDEILSQDAHGMPVAPVLARLAPPEPEPYHDSLDHVSHNGLTYGFLNLKNLRQPSKAGEVTRIDKNGKITPAPGEIAGYLTTIGKEIGFSVQIGPEGTWKEGTHGFPDRIDFEGDGPHYGGTLERNANTGEERTRGRVYLPDNTDDLYQRWVGLDRAQILWHEVGHAIDQAAFKPDKLSQRKDHEPPAIKAEMEMASRNFRPKQWDKDPDYTSGPNELFADAVAVWLSDPTAAARMPEFTAKYGEKLEPLRKIVNKAMPVRAENKEWIPNEEWKERQKLIRDRERKDIQAWKEGGGGIGPPEPPSGGWTSGDPPEWPKIGTEAPRGLHPDVIALKWSAKIGEAPKSTEHWNIDNAMRQIVSELHPARQIDKALHEIGSERFDKNKDIGLEDLFRQTYSSEQRAGYFTKFGTLNATDPTHITHKSDDHFAGAFEKAKKAGGTYEGFRNFLLALRTIDKAGQGIETGFKLDEAMVVAREGMKKYTEATKEWNRVNRAVLEYGRDRGVFSQGQIDAMTNANELAYVSLRRIAGDAPYAPGGGKGRGFRARNPLHRMEGDDGNIRDPILATLDNTAMIVKMADRNAAIGAVVLLAERGGLEEKGPWARLTKAEATATMAAPGEDKFTPYLKEDLKVPLDPFLAAKATRQGSDKNFVYLRDGVPEVWRAEDPHFAKLMRGADTPGEANFISKVATGFAHAARLGIVMPLDFMIRMPLRDQIGTYVLDPNHPPPFLTWAHGAMEAFGQGKEYREWIANGGGGGAMIDLSSNYLAREMHQSFNDRFSAALPERTPEQNGFPQIGREGGRELGPYKPENLHDTFEKTGTWNAMWNNVQHPIEALELLSQRLDASSRVGYYRKMREAGFTPVKAATMSRKAYLDFSEKATLDFMNTWAKWVPFMRPGILGMKQMGEAVINDPLRSAKYATTAIIAPSVMLYALNYLQDEYGDLPESRKYRNRDRLERDITFVFPEVMGFRLKLQTPPELGVLLHGSVDRFMDYLAYNRPVEFKEWAGKVVDSWTPNWMPTIALPAAEQWANKSLSTGRPLIPASMEQASGQLQYTENTTEVAKKLSKVLGPNTGAGIMQVSPIVIDNYVRQWTGTTGFAVMKALSAPFKSDNAPWELSDIPGLNGFISRQPGMNAYPIRQFFDEAKEAKQLVADKALIKKRQKLGADNQDEVDAYSTMAGLKLDRISKSLYNMREALGAMNNDKNMTTAEKRQFIEQTYSEMIVIAKDGVEFARKFKADQKDNGP